MPYDFGPLLDSIRLGPSSSLSGSSTSSTTSTSDRLVSLMTEIRSFQQIIAEFKEINVDPNEYKFLKGIALFKTCKSLINSQNQSQGKNGHINPQQLN